MAADSSRTLCKFNDLCVQSVLIEPADLPVRLVRDLPRIQHSKFLVGLWYDKRETLTGLIEGDSVSLP